MFRLPQSTSVHIIIITIENWSTKDWPIDPLLFPVIFYRFRASYRHWCRLSSRGIVNASTVIVALVVVVICICVTSQLITTILLCGNVIQHYNNILFIDSLYVRCSWPNSIKAIVWILYFSFFPYHHHHPNQYS